MPKLIDPLSRRRFLAGGVAALSSLPLSRLARAADAAAVPARCTLTPEQEVGPFFVDHAKLRRDLTEGKPGLPLELRLVLLDARSCTPLQNAAVDVWHCDAHGLYSGFTKTALGPPPDDSPGHAPRRGPPPGVDPSHRGPPPDFDPGHGGPPAMHPSDALTFLRGVQLTGADGAVEFQTIVPGFYMGRVNHIHFKVRTEGKAGAKSYAAGHISHVGQVFFPEALVAELMSHPPYSEHTIHRTTADEDGIFQSEHGELCVATMAPRAGGKGYRAELTVAVDPTATPAPVGMGGPPR